MPVVETRHTFRSTVHYLVKEEGKKKREIWGNREREREREREKRNDS